MNYSVLPRLALAVTLFLCPALLLALPVAVDDAYSTNEDTSLSVSVSALLDVDFETSNGGDGVIPFAGGTWSFLDRIENENGSADGYPTDGAGRAWTHLNFSESTSSITPWQSGSFPIQVGGLQAFPGAQTLLTGIGTANNGQNLVTTYLFTNTILLDEAPALGAEFSVDLLSDDGCIIYINGVDVMRQRMPDGAVTTQTLASETGNESEIESMDLNVPDGLLVPGFNAIAVEVHQVALTSSDAGLYLVLREGPASGGALGGFAYQDDLFGTDNAALAAGAREADVGFNGTAGLQVRAGGDAPAGQPATSGGWRRTFTLPAAGTVDVSLRYRLTANNGFEADEYIEARAEIDGVGIGTGTGGSLVRFVGDGNAGDDPDTGWLQRVVTVSLGAGTHTLDLGLFINQSTVASEIADVFFDDVLLTTAAGGGLGGVLANDTGIETSIAAQLLTQPSNGSVVMQTSGTFVYTPVNNFSGVDTFTYRVTDSTGDSSPATVSVTVNPVNDAPTGIGGLFSTPEDQVLSVSAAGGVLTGAADVDDPVGDLVAVLVSDVSDGTLLLDPTGAFTYSPEPNFTGTDGFTFSVSDGVAQSEVLTVSITVTPVDDPPVAVADAYSVDENGILVVSIATGSGAGDLVTLVPEGAEWRYLDDGSDQGVGWIATTFNDSGWETGIAQLGYGDGDEATVIGYGPDEENKYATTYFRRNFQVLPAEKVSIDQLEMQLVRDDGAAVYLNGTEVVRSNLAPEATFDTRAPSSTGNENDFREFDIDPALLVVGTNYLAVEVHQHDPDSSDLSFDMALTGRLSAVRGVLANDSDPEGAALSAAVEVGAAHGSLTLAADGTFSYTPVANFFGEDTFQYRVFAGGKSSVGTAAITVIPGPNDVPVAVADSYSVVEDEVLSVNALSGVLANDSDPDDDPMEAVLVGNPTHGSVSLNSDGSFTYTPAQDFSGGDSFVYRAVDPLGASGNTVVTVDVTPVNDAPVAVADLFVVQPGQVFSGNVLTNDTDVDIETLTAVLVGNVSQGTLSLASNGTFSYNPGAFVGSDIFFYDAVDAAGLRSGAQVLLQVNGRPVTVADGYSVVEDGVLNVPVGLGVLANDSDPESGTIAALLSADVANGNLSLAADGSFSYTPDANFSGTDAFTYVASDGFQTSASVLVTINVQAVNDVPVAVADDYAVITNTPLSVSAVDGVLANDSDADGDTLQAVLVANVSSGSLSLAGDGGFDYTPALGFEGDVTFTYRAQDSSSNSEATVTLHIGPDLDSVKISEIMYHPESDLDSQEYIELTNTGTNPVDLSGWSFGDGVDFTFPAVTLPPGGFLAVAADVAAFESLYGAIGNVVGGWSGRLSNSGERVRLYSADGVKVDDVTYADEGEWAARERISGTRGWDWNSAHDGGGQSLELISTGVSNKYGQNWSASIGAPSPGSANTVAATSVAPLILDVAHQPVVPKSDEPVRVTARLLDVEGESLSASLFWREATSSPSGFSQVTMVDDGDGVYGATLPPMSDGTLVEFYVLASDGTNGRTWPAVTNIGQVANAHFQVDDEAHSGSWPIYRILMTAEELDNFDGVNRSSNERFHATLILDDCSGPVARYNSSIRVRGAGSRSHNPPPMRAAVPHDNPWNDRTAMNWNTKYTYSQYIGMRLFQGAGMAAPDGKPMRLRWNGDDRMRGDGFDYGLAVHMEVLDGDFIDDKIPDDADGNLYKKGRPDREWAFRDGDIGGYMNDAWSKETNADENLWGDLDGFLDVMNNAPGAPDYVAQVEAVADLDQWMKWFGTMAIIANGETNAATGADDDYSMYHGVVDPRFIFIPHDLDTILSNGDGSRITNPEHTIFDMISRGDVLDPLVPLFTDASIRVRYHQALRDLLQGSFAKAEFDELVENSLSGWVPSGEIADIISFMDARRIYITGLVDAELGAAPPVAKGTTSATLASGHGTLMISEVLAANISLDYFGTLPDYVEIYNSGGSAVNLAGMTMTDDPAEPAKFTFPADTILAAGERLLVLGDSDPATPGLHLGFGLGAKGDHIQLMNGATLIDSLTFGRQIGDYSLSRTGTGLNTWALSPPTPQTANVAQPLGDPSNLRLNEWLTQPEIVFERDFIEIYNPSTLPVAMGGLAITDEPATEPMRVQLPPLSFIGSGGFAVFEAIGDKASPGDSSELPFKLGSDQGWLAISGANGVEIDEVHYLCHTLDVSQGRNPDGGASYADYTLPTPGFSNRAILDNEIAILAGLRITELMYHPAGSESEYVELRNVGDEPFNLNGVSFTEGIAFDFPSLVLQPGEYVLIVQDPVAFDSAFGSGLNVAGAYDGKLSNGGERLRLEITVLGAGILDFDYNDSWYATTDGDGFALEIIDPLGLRSSWGQRESWRAGSVAGGTPGASGVDLEAYDNWVVAEFGAPLAGQTGKLDDPDDDGVANVLEFALGGDPLVGNRGEMLDLSTEGGFLALTYRRAVTSVGLVALVPEVAGDNFSWQSGGGLTVQQLLGSDGQFETWRVRDATPIGSGQRRFLRIRGICLDE